MGQSRHSQEGPLPHLPGTPFPPQKTLFQAVGAPEGTKGLSRDKESASSQDPNLWATPFMMALGWVASPRS